MLKLELGWISRLAERGGAGRDAWAAARVRFWLEEYQIGLDGSFNNVCARGKRFILLNEVVEDSSFNYCMCS
jgi:hypothetical protein